MWSSSRLRSGFHLLSFAAFLLQSEMVCRYKHRRNKIIFHIFLSLLHVESELFSKECGFLKSKQGNSFLHFKINHLCLKLIFSMFLLTFFNFKYSNSSLMCLHSVWGRHKLFYRKKKFRYSNIKSAIVQRREKSAGNTVGDLLGWRIRPNKFDSILFWFDFKCTSKILQAKHMV